MNASGGARYALAAALTAILSLAGCNAYLAEQVVTAPNLHEPSRGVDAPAQRLGKLYIDRQLRVNVGPPDASILVWITDPFTGTETIDLEGNGTRIAATIHRSPATEPSTRPAVKGTVFLLHGIEDQMELGPYILYSQMLAGLGYRCIQLDLRGHGRSTGRWLTFGVVERRDLVQVLDELDRQGLIAGKVGVMGISYGAAIAIQWASIDPRIRAVVALEPYATLEDAAIDAAPLVLGHNRWMFSDNDLRDALKLAGRRAGFDPAEASALRAIPQVSVPVLLIHSRDDELIPFRHTERLHDANPRYVRVIPISGQSHFRMWLDSRGMIEKASRIVLDRFIAGESAGHQPVD